MPESARRFENVRAATPVRLGDVLLLAIERVVVRSGRAGRGAWVLAAAEPYALVVRDAGGARAIELDGTAIPLERLREQVPELDGLLGQR